MAESFSSKRDHISHDISILSEYCNKNDVVLDLGCGNGRLSEVLDCKYIGIDTSKKMIEIAKERYPDKEFLITNPLNFPFPDNHFDKIFCLAVFHHIPSKRLRQEFLKEIRRILKGELILTVWDLNDNEKARRLIRQTIWKKFLTRLWYNLDFNDIYYPFKDSERLIAKRFIHVFNLKTLEKEISKVFTINRLEKQVRSERGSNLFVQAENLL